MSAARSGSSFSPHSRRGRGSISVPRRTSSRREFLELLDALANSLELRRVLGPTSPLPFGDDVADAVVELGDQPWPISLRGRDVRGM